MDDRFDDLRAAGRQLAIALESFAAREQTIVLGLARGGVPAAAEVAAHLRLPLDVVMIQRMLLRGPLDPIGAASVAGHLIIDDELSPIADPPQSPIDFHLHSALQTLVETARARRGDKPVVEIAGLTVLLVDCGARSGSTVRAAIRGIRRLAPARVIVALPTAAPEARAILESSADEVISLRWPSPYGNVAMWYRRFDVPSSEEVRAMLSGPSQPSGAGS